MTRLLNNWLFARRCPGPFRGYLGGLVISLALWGMAFVSVAEATSPNAAVVLNGSTFYTGQTANYQGTVLAGTATTQVDLYFGSLLPDGVTFFSLVQASPGVIYSTLGPRPIPFQANVPFTNHVANFAYRFAGTELVGEYFAYAAATVAGSDPLQIANHLSLAVQSYRFSLTPPPPPPPPPPTSTAYYVATTGNDGNPGTDASPFRTISRGVSVLRPGNTLYIKSGTYAERLSGIPSGTSWSQPVTVAAYPGHAVTIKPNSGTGALQFSGSQQYIVIDGLILDGTNLADDTDLVSVVSAAHHIRIQRSEVKNSQGNGLYVRSSSANEFIDLDIHHNGRDALDHGIYVATDAKGNLVEQSLVYSNAGWGIHLYHANGGVANNIIRSNQVYDHAERGIFVSSGTGNRIYNNVVWGNAKEGILVGQYGSPVQDTGIYNNTLYANGHGMTVGSNSSGTVLRNNLVYQSGGISNSGTGTVSDHNLVGLDPRFVNAAGGDFHLQAGSPAIDTGVTVSAVTTDFDDIPRPQGAAYNIGAFE